MTLYLRFIAIRRRQTLDLVSLLVSRHMHMHTEQQDLFFLISMYLIFPVRKPFSPSDAISRLREIIRASADTDSLFSGYYGISQHSTLQFKNNHKMRNN